MTANQLMFTLFAAVIIVFSVLTVTSRRILRAATYLLFVLVATAGLYFLLKFNFLAAIQLTLYAGGIVVLIIFSILLTSHIAEKLEKPSLSKKLPALLAAGAGAVLTILTILQYQFPAEATDTGRTNIREIAHSLISTEKFGYALPFEVISVLLLAAMVGAIILAKKRKD
ncbi:MAG TPA: NADH-quinone oxidoreductase subunit J [Bacteroidales bacterium]|nr:NADH-quinone oxidoreductase subunit J [Bacteroidales bacterium]HPS63328.1 NADH-quinone oxidoreductase subunit J [Bacteroidales bacterium]